MEHTGVVVNEQQQKDEVIVVEKRIEKVEIKSPRKSRRFFNPDQKIIEEIYREYSEICVEEDRSKLELDQNPLNMEKNRYPDVLVIKSTAVRLGGSDYINANFVIDKSNTKQQKYICCQAPLSSTFTDFWRMIWEYEVPVIVMITNLVEKNRIKADPYWPTELKSVMCYGNILVKLVREKKTRGNNVTIRTFKIWKTLVPEPTVTLERTTKNDTEEDLPSSCQSTPSESEASDDKDDSDCSSDELEPIDGQETRTVVQLHCTKWPDFGVPKSTGVMKDLIAEVELRKKEEDKPIVVHCSAGIGRTGTFVAIHINLRRHLLKEPISIKDTVRSLRSQRLGMVQSKEQYMFVYAVVQDIVARREKRRVGTRLLFSPQPNKYSDLTQTHREETPQSEQQRRQLNRRATIQAEKEHSPSNFNIEEKIKKKEVPTRVVCPEPTTQTLQTPPQNKT